MSKPIRVLAVDDSAMARNAYRLLLKPEDGFDLIATAPNADIGRRKITQLDPDVVILDIEMPGEDGLSVLKWLMAHFPVPVVVSSSYSARGAEQTMQAFSLGAVEVVCKGGPAGHEGWSQDFSVTLTEAVRAAATVRRKARFPLPQEAKPARPATPAAPRNQRLRRGNCVVIGASTGGTEALAALVAQMPADFPPTLVVQHMPPIYTNTFANRLDRLGAVHVREAQDGACIGPGEVLIAPGGKQMRIDAGGAGPVARISAEGPYNRHAPSVDILFHSAALHYRARTIGLLLTGMGNDGADGLLAIRSAGGLTLAQDENSCVVYGMPQEAVKRGAVDKILDLNAMVPHLLRHLAP